MPTTLRLAVTISATSELTLLPSDKVQTDPTFREMLMQHRACRILEMIHCASSVALGT